MKKTSKLFAIFLAIAMILTMAVPAFAESGAAPVDTMTYVTVTGLMPGDTIRYGQILELDANQNAYVLTELGKAAAKKAGNEADNCGLTEQEMINAFVDAGDGRHTNDNLLKMLHWFDTYKRGSNVTDAAGNIIYAGDNGEIRFPAGPGVYAIKAVNGPNSSDVIYSPMMFASVELDYDSNGNLVGGRVDADSTVAAKKTTTDVDKKITDDTNDVNAVNIGINTYHLGDTVHYQVKLDVPDYPADAINKTLYIYDNFPEGVTYDRGSVEYAVLPVATEPGENTSWRTPSVEAGEGVSALLLEDRPEATFGLIFGYDALGLSSENVVFVRYTGKVNSEAFVGQEGNTNTVFKIEGDPYKGSNWDPQTPPPSLDKPSGKDENPFEGYAEKHDSETVYTYGFYIVKTDSKEEKYLQGAEFKVYTKSGNSYNEVILTDESGSHPATFVTNEEGIGGIAGLAAGTYYVKETKAPAGYSLLNDYVAVTTNFVSSKSVTEHTTVSSWSGKTVTYYEAILPGMTGKIQAKNDKNQDLYLTKENGGQITTEKTEFPAYVKSTSTVYGNSTSETKTTTKTEIYEDAGKGVEAKGYPGYQVKNTKLGQLPSTGGVGTILFSVIGIAGMMAAVYIFFANRKRISR